MKFNLEDHRGINVGMHLSNIEEIRIFFNYLSKHGCRWSSGEEYDIDNQDCGTNFAIKQETNYDIVLFFNKGLWCRYDGSVDFIHRCVEFSDFDWSEETAPIYEDFNMTLEEILRGVEA